MISTVLSLLLRLLHCLFPTTLPAELNGAPPHASTSAVSSTLYPFVEDISSPVECSPLFLRVRAPRCCHILYTCIAVNPMSGAKTAISTASRPNKASLDHEGSVIEVDGLGWLVGSAAVSGRLHFKDRVGVRYILQSILDSSRWRQERSLDQKTAKTCCAGCRCEKIRIWHGLGGLG
ncbi:hypothetical protein BKA63DRAFT_220768 [Paraphoma chrysanthemicola]|nr:hypothetical protein BKA63DRAFT_220768 [Paraphoma chrysanthemicola]